MPCKWTQRSSFVRPHDRRNVSPSVPVNRKSGWQAAVRNECPLAGRKTDQGPFRNLYHSQPMISLLVAKRSVEMYSTSTIPVA